MHRHLTRAFSWRRIFAGALVALLAVAFTACGNTKSTSSSGDSSPSGGSSGAGASTKGVKVGLIMLQGDTYYQGVQAGLEAAVKADGGTVVTGLSNNDPGTEAQVAQNMIQSGVKIILMQPAGADASIKTMQTIQQAGITLICYGNCTDAALDPANSSGVIQSDNTALGTGTGEVAAKYFAAHNLKAPKIAILNCDVASACKLRKAGFKKALADAGINADYVTDQEGYLTDKATTVAADILTAHPDIDAIWASNDGGTTGAVIAVQQASKKIPVFGTDISTQIAQFIKAPDDILQVTTGQDPVKTAQGAYEMAKKAMAGGTNSPFEVDLPGIVYDRSNAATTDEFLAANK